MDQVFLRLLRNHPERLAKALFVIAQHMAPDHFCGVHGGRICIGLFANDASRATQALYSGSTQMGVIDLAALVLVVLLGVPHGALDPMLAIRAGVQRIGAIAFFLRDLHFDRSFVLAVLDRLWALRTDRVFGAVDLAFWWRCITRGCASSASVGLR